MNGCVRLKSGAAYRPRNEAKPQIDRGRISGPRGFATPLVRSSPRFGLAAHATAPATTEAETTVVVSAPNGGTDVE